MSKKKKPNSTATKFLSHKPYKKVEQDIHGSGEVRTNWWATVSYELLHINTSV